MGIFRHGDVSFMGILPYPITGLGENGRAI